MWSGLFKNASHSVAAPTTPPATPQPARPRLGLALGSGVARGWFHIGVLREFEAVGLRPDIIAGTSVGAVVGGSYAAGLLDELEVFARKLTRRRIFTWLDPSLHGGGLFGGRYLRNELNRQFNGRTFDQLDISFAAVATELSTGHEIWLRQGPIAPAIVASYSLPGILEPQNLGGRLLVDGALVNPTPVSVCRALGADVVVAVALVTDSMFRGGVRPDTIQPAAIDDSALEDPKKNAGRSGWRRYLSSPTKHNPGIISIMFDSYAIIQDRIARSRLAGDPPDIYIGARLERFGLFDFHRADEMIDLGRKVARNRIPEILDFIGYACDLQAPR